MPYFCGSRPVAELELLDELLGQRAARALGEERVLAAYEEAVYAGDIARDLKPVRNTKPLWSRFGTYIGFALAGVDMWINTIIPGGLPFTLKHKKPDYATLKRAQNARPSLIPNPTAC